MPCSITARVTSVSRRVSVRPPTRSVPPSGPCWRIKAPPALPVRPEQTVRRDPKVYRGHKVYRVRWDRKAQPERTVRRGGRGRRARRRPRGGGGGPAVGDAP